MDENSDAANKTSVEPSRAIAQSDGPTKAKDLRVGASGVAFAHAGEMIAFANLMAKAGEAVPPQFRDNPGGCLAVISDSIAFGIHPFALARQAYFVGGTLAYMAQAISAMIIARAPIVRRPHYAFEGDGDAMVCTVTVTTTDGDVIEHRSPKINEIAVRNAPNWKHDRQQQLGYYTIRAMARRHFPDILMGIYSREEAENFRQIENEPASSSIIDRLPGASAGPVVDHIEKEVNGHDEPNAAIKGNSITTEKLTTSETGVPDDTGMSGADKTLLIEIEGALAVAANKDEAEVAYSEFEESVNHAGEECQKLAGALIANRRKALRKEAASKSAAAKTLL